MSLDNTVVVLKNNKNKHLAVLKDDQEFVTQNGVIKFNDNCFYKMQNASLKDPIFDYYRIKKENLDEDIRNYARKITPRKIKYRLKKDSEFKYETKKTELLFH